MFGHSGIRVGNKADNLAGAHHRGRDELVPLDSEREDSGIDSDADRCPHHHHFSDESGSDEELVVKPPWVRIPKKNDVMKDMDDANSDGSDMMIPMRRKNSFYGNSLEPDRNSSPPLYEVELTASDEDDDASVLELVIPVQTSRYHRVPTSSPKRGLPTPPTFLYNLFCCVRK